MGGRWTTISLPTRLTADIKQFTEEVGYWNSLSAFVREAALEKLNRERAKLGTVSMEEAERANIKAYVKAIVEDLEKRRTKG